MRRRPSTHHTPASLRHWFIAHFVVDLVVGLPLLFVPGTALGHLGWTAIDPATARLCGACLVAMAIQTFTVRDGSTEALRTVLNFKMLWSWIASGALLLAWLDGAPDPVWAYMAVFVGLSGVWFHYQVRLGQMEKADELDLPKDPDADAELLAKLPPLDPMDTTPPPEGVAEKVHAGTSFDKLNAEDIAAFKAEADRKRAEDAEAARAAAEAAAWEAAAPAADTQSVPSWGDPAAAPANKTIHGFPTPEAPNVPAKAASADEASADDIAAMLAANETTDTGSEDKAGADDIAAMLAASNAGDEAGGGDQASADDIAAMLAGNQGSDDQASADDIAAMLAGDVPETDGPTPSNPAAAEEIEQLLEEERARQAAAGEAPALLSADERAAQEAELAAWEASAEPMLSPTEAPPAAEEVDVPIEEAPMTDTIQNLAAPSPDEVTAADVVTEEPSPPATEEAGSDDIAAMLAESHADKPNPPSG